jgi:hypothetical protein
MKPRAGVVEAIKGSFETMAKPDFWMQTVAPMGVGFIGSQFLGGITYGLAEKLIGADKISGTGLVPSLARIGSRAIGAGLASTATLLITRKSDAAAKTLAGGMVAVVASILMEVLGADNYAKITGMAEIGDMAADLTSELKSRIAESVRGEIARAESTDQGVNAFVTTQDLAPAPTLGPGPRVGESMDAFVTAEDLQTAPQPGVEQPVVSDLSAFSDSSADMALI